MQPGPCEAALPPPAHRSRGPGSSAPSRAQPPPKSSWATLRGDSCRWASQLRAGTNSSLALRQHPGPPGIASARRFGASARRHDPFRHAPGVRHDRQRRVGPGAGRERAAIDDIEVVDLVRPAVAVQHRAVRVVAHPRRAVLVRAVAGDAVDVDLLHPARPRRLQDLGVAVDQKAPHREVVLVRAERDARHRQAPRVHLVVVEVDPVLVPRHVVNHHRDGHAVVVVEPVDVLGRRTPARRARKPPVDRQRDADAGGRDVAAADKTALGVVLVELERAGADVAAAGPRVDGIVEQPDRGAVFVERHVAPDQVAAVGKPVRKPARPGKQQQPRRLDRAARQQEHVGGLLVRPAVGILVDRGANLAGGVEGQLAHVAARA